MKKPGNGNRTGGFTLVELMVAIVIILVLAGLVFGLSQSALSKSRLAGSVSRVRDLGVRVEGYSQDNAGILPVWKDESQALYWWGMLVKDPKNESQLSIFKSPGDKDFDENKIENTVSYGWNARVVGRSEDPNGEDGPKRKVSFKNPSEILVLADGAGPGSMGLLDQGKLPDPKRYDGKAAALMLDGSGRTLIIESEFRSDSKWLMTEEERDQRE